MRQAFKATRKAMAPKAASVMPKLVIWLPSPAMMPLMTDASAPLPTCSAPINPDAAPAESGLTETAAAVAGACEAGQQTITPTRVVVPEVDREAALSSGDDIIDDEDTEGAAEADDEDEGEDGADRVDAAASAALEVFA